jgi:hypothetical protein
VTIQDALAHEERTGGWPTTKQALRDAADRIDELEAVLIAVDFWLAQITHPQDNELASVDHAAVARHLIHQAFQAAEYRHQESS